jgi:ABC-type branched-subunit amino acid transport system ATPase component/branched-subunit amino acid ABC-type transport system permease component
MTSVLPFLIIGVVSGSIYGMAAVGLVLSYRTSGIFNFAHGALATLAAYVFYWLHYTHGMPWPYAAIISVVPLSIALGFSLERFARILARSSLILQVVGTVGLLLIIEAACTQWYGSNGSFYPAFLSLHTYAVGGTFVTASDIIIVAISIVSTALLYLMLKFTRLGTAMRAVVDDPDLLSISGINPVSVRRAAWVIGSFLVTLSGLLLAPNLGLDATSLTLLVVQAFGAAAIGRFQSLPWTWVGGIVIGVAASLATKYFTSVNIFSGLPSAIPFIILFGVLVFVRQQNSIDSSTRRASRELAPTNLPLQFQLSGAVVVVGALIAVPFVFPDYLTAWMGVLTDVILLSSLGLLVRISRQVSLCQITFAAIGAVAFSRFASAGVPWLLALLLAGLFVVPIGALLALPAVRLSGLYLALATLGFGLLVQTMFYDSSWMFGLENLGIPEPRPHISWLHLGSDRGFYYVILFFVVVSTVFCVWLIRGRLGGLLRVLGESPLTLEAFGVNTLVTRILVFCLSAFLASIAGALSGSALGTATGQSFEPLTSLNLFVIVVIAAFGEPWFALFGALLVGLIPAYFASQTATNILQLAFGVGALTYSIGMVPKRPKIVERLAESAAARKRRKIVPSTESAQDRTGLATTLHANEITVRFGGLVAVDSVSITARTGKVTGVIGPNGAGKTTLFNACSGLNTPSSGTIVLDENDVSKRRPSVRARLGLGRTFQQVQLCDSLSVEENVRIGAEGGFVGASAFRHLFRGRTQSAIVAQRGNEALALTGIEALAHRTVSTLPTGQRRLVELARCLAGRFTILLLDEPSSGLDAQETAEFGALLRRVVDERDIGILLIEHDLSLTMNVCDELYVLEFGSLIYQGTPEDARTSASVQAAYLGDAVLQS